MRTLTIVVLFILLLGCGKVEYQIPTYPTTSQTPIVEASMTPQPTPTPSPTPSNAIYRPDRVCADSDLQEAITVAYQQWQIVKPPVFVKDKCNILFIQRYEPNNTEDGGQSYYNGLWWFYDGFSHIYLNMTHPSNLKGTLWHELGHHFGLDHAKNADGSWNCDSIMSNCSKYGVTENDIVILRVKLT